MLISIADGRVFPENIIIFYRIPCVQRETHEMMSMSQIYCHNKPIAGRRTDQSDDAFVCVQQLPQVEQILRREPLLVGLDVMIQLVGRVTHLTKKARVTPGADTGLQPGNSTVFNRRATCYSRGKLIDNSHPTTE